MTIKIRKATSEDVEKIAEMIKEGVKRKNWIYTATNKPWSKKRIQEIKESYSKRPLQSLTFIAIDKKENKVVGSMSLRFFKGRIKHKVNLGWGVHPDYQGKGIATELLKKVLNFVKKKKLKKVEAEIAVENKPSIRLAKKFGFKIEGRKKKDLLSDTGRYIDTYIVGKILK